MDSSGNFFNLTTKQPGESDRHFRARKDLADAEIEEYRVKNPKGRLTPIKPDVPAKPSRGYSSLVESASSKAQTNANFARRWLKQVEEEEKKAKDEAVAAAARAPVIPSPPSVRLPKLERIKPFDFGTEADPLEHIPTHRRNRLLNPKFLLPDNILDPVRGKVYFVLVGDVNAKGLRRAVQSDLAHFKGFIDNVFFDEDNRDLRNAAEIVPVPTENLSFWSILTTIRDLEKKKLSNNDTVVFYFSGHGAFEERRLQVHQYSGAPTRLVPVTAIKKALERTGAGLRVILSDACSSVAGQEDQIFTQQVKQIIRPRWNLIRELFFEAKGTVVLHAAFPGETAMGPASGSLFTKALVDLLYEEPKLFDSDLDGHATWKEFSAKVRLKTGTSFLTWRDSLPAGHPYQYKRSQTPTLTEDAEASATLIGWNHNKMPPNFKAFAGGKPGIEFKGFVTALRQPNRIVTAQVQFYHSAKGTMVLGRTEPFTASDGRLVVRASEEGLNDRDVFEYSLFVPYSEFKEYSPSNPLRINYEFWAYDEDEQILDYEAGGEFDLF